MAEERPKGAVRVIWLKLECSDVLRRYLRRRVSPLVVEELFQDVWLRAVRCKTALSEARDPRAYLFGIAANVVREHYRKSATERKRVRIGTILLKPDKEERDTPLDLLEREERDALTRKAIRLLPPMHKAVLCFIDIEGLSYKETADRLRLSADQVDRYLHQARSRLQVLLRKLLERDDP